MMPDMNLPKVGDRVKVVVPPHEEGHEEGVVRQALHGALGIEFDSAPGAVHQWYVPSEVMVIEAAPMPGDMPEDMDTMKRAGPKRMKSVSRRYLQSLQAAQWAILPDYLAIISDLIRLRAAGERLTEDEIQARLGAVAERPEPPKADGAIAILPLFGVMAHRMDLMTAMSGGTSTERYLRQFQAAVADPAVKAILLLVDSPGGVVNGTIELADAVFQARGTKPIVAHIDTLGASAALWVASQADQMIASPSAQVGSIGVLAIHQEISKMAEREGVTTTILREPDAKAEGNPFEPLSEAAKADVTAKIAATYAQFVGAVARGRGVSPDVVRKDYGEGRVLLAKDALRVGLVDKVATVDDTLARLASKRSGLWTKPVPAATAESITYAPMNTTMGEFMSMDEHLALVAKVAEDDEADARLRRLRLEEDGIV